MAAIVRPDAPEIPHLVLSYVGRQVSTPGDASNLSHAHAGSSPWVPVSAVTAVRRIFR